jgi:hypothetical protein
MFLHLICVRSILLPKVRRFLLQVSFLVVWDISRGSNVPIATYPTFDTASYGIRQANVGNSNVHYGPLVILPSISLLRVLSVLFYVRTRLLRLDLISMYRVNMPPVGRSNFYQQLLSGETPRIECGKTRRPPTNHSRVFSVIIRMPFSTR